jgi:Domain of unknown function (DUF4190)
MSSTNSPQDPYGTGDQPDRSSGSTPPPGEDSSQPPYGATPPAYGSTPQAPYGSTPPAYGSTPEQYGSSQPPAYGGSSAYGSTPPAYGAEYGGTQSPYAYGTYPQNNLGVWSLVLGLVAIFVCGLLAGIPAVIVGNRAKRAVAAGEANNPGMATAGIVLGWVSIILSIIGAIIVIGLIATGGILETTGTTTSF